MNNSQHLTISFLLITMLSGCGVRYFSPRETNPVIEDYIGTYPSRELGTLATDAARRINVTRMESTHIPTNDSTWRRGEFCAEPPPDAMVNIAGAFGAAIAANIKAYEPTTGKVAGEGTGNAEFFRTISTVMLPLLRRSQGLQWQRDGLSFACNSFLNRVITRAQYVEWVKDIRDQSKLLIEAEIQKLPKADFDITLKELPETKIIAPNLGVAKKDAKEVEK